MPDFVWWRVDAKYDDVPKGVGLTAIWLNITHVCGPLNFFHFVTCFTCVERETSLIAG